MIKSGIKIHPLPSEEHKPTKKEVGQLSVDIYKKPGELIILAPIAGLTEDDISISLTEDVLVIKGERELKEQIPEESYYTRECFWGNFSRAIVLPEEADTRSITANFENNVLEIHIPLSEKTGTQIIKIKSPK